MWQAILKKNKAIKNHFYNERRSETESEVKLWSEAE